MPISPLPQSTVRLLGSSVVISKPCDVVKELLDNAIDAGASFVEIAISPNYLDTIRVRDDGQGIDIEDFDALGRRTHTSKLRAFDELGSRARETLGFRGEALAAMNSLATITVTTRTVKDVVATRLQLKPKAGGVDNRQPVSAPVGTTVQITKLFDTLPVRKQYSLKNSAKYIQSTKDLLKACALARPDLRLSFKVLGEATHCWSYAPVCAAGVKEAALQIFGTTLANNCVYVSRNSACDQTTSPQLHQQLPEDFILEALIPKPGFEVQAVKGKGFYLSIDSRPISSQDAMAKKLIAIYKPYLNRAAGTGESCTSIPNPFVQLNIRCPPNSYDVNVTPLKNEVVFGNEGTITACFEGLCRKIYPQRSTNGPVSTHRPLGHEEEVGASTKDRNESEGIQLCSAIGRLPDAPTPDSSSTTQSLHSAEHLTKLQGTRREQTVDQESAQTLLSEQSCTQSATSLARLRTCKTVNMFRTNSNSTDEDSAADTVEIQVPQSFMTATIPSSKRAGRSLRIPNKSISENIERYLLPGKDTTFQIATDETATKETQPASVTSTSPTKFPGRIPLQPLTDATLNAMNGQEDSESNTLSAGSEIPEPNNNTRSIVATNQTDQIFQQTSLNPTLSPFEPEPLEYSSPNQSRSVTEWPTPPASGNLRSARPFNSPFRPPLRTSQRDSPTGNIANTRSRVRAPESGRVIPFTLPGQTRAQRPTVLGRTTQQVGLAGTPRSNAETGVIHPQLHPQRVHGLSRQRDMDQNLTQDAELASRQDTRDDVSQPHLSLHRPDQHSPFLQTPFMRALLLGITPAPNTGQGDPSAGDAVSMVQMPDISPTTLVRHESRDVTPPDNKNDNIEDSRLYLIKRRRSQARHGIARRISSRQLPLEVVPNHLTMRNASTSLRPPARKVVESLFTRADWLDYGARKDKWGYAVEFQSMGEVTKLEKRLHNVVESWKQTQNQSVEVEYKLRSAAKGKGMSGEPLAAPQYCERW